MDMQNKTVHIMDPPPNDVGYKGYDQSMPYIATFHTIAKRKLGCFLLYHFMKSWDGIRLALINTLSTSLKMKFLADILKSHANECFDSFPQRSPSHE
uniref:Uncharacterized protein n=1 Tax=Saccharum spontaneum TaxID=62335 RepID=A0A678T687_SACSP|nr:hypothetical protein SS20H10_000011 [Saccharum spontaneum]